MWNLQCFKSDFYVFLHNHGWSYNTPWYNEQLRQNERNFIDKF